MRKIVVVGLLISGRLGTTGDDERHPVEREPFAGCRDNVTKRWLEVESMKGARDRNWRVCRWVKWVKGSGAPGPRKGGSGISSAETCSPEPWAVGEYPAWYRCMVRRLAYESSAYRVKLMVPLYANRLNLVEVCSEYWHVVECNTSWPRPYLAKARCS